MAEAFEVFKRFEYRQNSNLVLQREGPGPTQDEPTGEPESLAGRVTFRMGDKVERQTPRELLRVLRERQAKQTLKRSRDSAQVDAGLEAVIMGRITPNSSKKKRRSDGEDELLDSLGGKQMYAPTTVRTKMVYQALLENLMKLLGDVPREVLIDAANDVVCICRTDSVSDTTRHKGVNELLSVETSEEQFTKIYQFCRLLTDFEMKDEFDEARESTDIASQAGLGLGVAVVFDEQDDEANDDLGYQEAVDEDEESGDITGGRSSLVHGESVFGTSGGDEEDGPSSSTKGWLEGEARGLAERATEFEKLRSIDAHWLQRQLQQRGIVSSKDDPSLVVQKEKSILEILSCRDSRECENRLVGFLQYEYFDFVELLMKNRFEIYYQTRLGQAQSSAETEEIREQMEATEEGRAILARLKDKSKKSDKEKDLSMSVRDEAAALAVSSALKAQDMAMKNKAEEGDSETRQLGISSSHRKRLNHQNADVDMMEDEEDEDALPVCHPNLELSSLVFSEGSHLMTEQSIKLPEGSKRIDKSDYDEIIVPPLQRQKDSTDINIAITQLPEWSRPVFSNVGITHLNPVQSKVFDVAFHQFQKNMLVCAPTGAGKTNIALLAILNLFDQYRLPHDPNAIDASQFKVVYISPMKALVAEQVAAFSKRLECFPEIHVRELTGDMQLSRQQIEDTQIVVTTPEKWDVITRRSGERAYTQLVKLIIFDEIHLLHDMRGPVIETLVVRAIRQMEQTQNRIRLVGLSATLPNYEDVAMFLRVDLSENGGLFYFGNQYRPVPLVQTFVGVRSKKATKRYNLMNNVCYEKVLEDAGKNQVLVFVHSRKETAKTAKALRDRAVQEGALINFVNPESPSRAILSSEAENAISNDLKDLLPYGFGIHHAGLSRNDRKLVEDLFADKHIQVLVSTATLAWGVNLPAHTVIIKGTKVYWPDKGVWGELSPLDVMQMMGRAGRPQYDTSGHGIIITQQSQLQFYLSLNNQQLPIESQLISQLPEILNSEIVLNTIKSRQEAVRWLGYTYLFVRMLRSPKIYKADKIPNDDAALTRHRIDLANAALQVLAKHRLVNYESRTGSVQSTALGRVASFFYIKMETVSILNTHMSSMMSEIELLRLFSICHEFSNIPVRDEEQLELARLVDQVPIPVKGHLGEPASKINVLLQAYISGFKLEGFALMCDVTVVQQNAPRIMRAIFTIALKRNWSTTAQMALNFCKMIDRRMWMSMTPLRQFGPVLGEALIRRIERKDFPWNKIVDLSSTDLGELVREPKLGKLLHKLVHQVPKVDLSVFAEPITSKLLKLEVTITPDFEWNPKVHSNSEMFWIMVENVDGNQLLHCEEFVLTKNKMNQDHVFEFLVPILMPLNPNYFLRVVSDRWLHSESSTAISFKDLILPSKNQPHTELLDLHPLPVSALEFPQVEELYLKKPDFRDTRCFNAIQTQVYSVLYGSNDNCLVCAPAGSGLLTCAEFAIFRALKQAEEVPPKIVAMCAHDETARNRFEYWERQYADTLGLKIAQSSGDSNTDYKQYCKSDWFVTTPTHWEAVTRRWKTRKMLHKINLFIVFDLHLLGSPSYGSGIEVCISRMKFASTTLGMKLRIVAFSAPLCNARDVGDWLGVAKPSLIFSFHTNVRPIPLDLGIVRFDLNHRETRLIAMYKPVQHILEQKAVKGRNAIIFVPDRREGRIIAIEILLQAMSMNTPDMYRRIPEAEMNNIIKNLGVSSLREKSLYDILPKGVGLIHEGMRQIEIDLVSKLFCEDCIQIVIISGSMTWGLSYLTAHLVIIFDTEIWNGFKKRWVHYSVPDVLHMIGHAGRPSIDDSIGSSAVLMCHSSRREEYRQFIYDAYPLESCLDFTLADQLLPEIVAKTIKTKQDAIDWLTWTFNYRRLPKNPNYYGLKGSTHDHICDHLSDLIETSTEQLVEANCVAVGDNELDISPLNLGLIASFYNLKCSTVDTFSRLAVRGANTKLILEILTTATEVSNVIPIRNSEEIVLERLFTKMNMSLSLQSDSAAGTVDFTAPHVKALILLSAHFRREPINIDLQSDLSLLLVVGLRLVFGFVDVVASNSWLVTVLKAMQLSQMLIQAIDIGTSSQLLQLPHVTPEIAQMWKDTNNIQTVAQLIECEDQTRSDLFQNAKLTESQVNDIAECCNDYPVLDVSIVCSAAKSTSVDPDTSCHHFEIDKSLPSFDLELEIVREGEDDDEPMDPNTNIAERSVKTRYFPTKKLPEWWLVVGNAVGQTVVVIRKIGLPKAKNSVKLSVEIPREDRNDEAGLKLKLYITPDSYVGCDLEFPLLVRFT